MSALSDCRKTLPVDDWLDTRIANEVAIDACSDSSAAVPRRVGSNRAVAISTPRCDPCGALLT
jgi:hypothetical protein